MTQMAAVASERKQACVGTRAQTQSADAGTATTYTPHAPRHLPGTRMYKVIADDVIISTRYEYVNVCASQRNAARATIQVGGGRKGKRLATGRG